MSRQKLPDHTLPSRLNLRFFQPLRKPQLLEEFFHGLLDPD
jgi:hypothetical protein